MKSLSTNISLPLTFRSLPMSLSLNYLVVGDNPDRIFTVEISKNKNISILKKLIKVEKARHFRVEHVDASDLELWQVSFLIDDLEKELGNINPHFSPMSRMIVSML